MVADGSFVSTGAGDEGEAEGVSDDSAGGEVNVAVAVVAPVSWIKPTVALSWNLPGFYCGSPSATEDPCSKNALRECVVLNHLFRLTAVR